MVMRISRIALPAATLFAALTGVNSQALTDPADPWCISVRGAQFGGGGPLQCTMHLCRDQPSAFDGWVRLQSGLPDFVTPTTARAACLAGGGTATTTPPPPPPPPPIPPITPSDVMAANEECGKAEAAAISASWTRDQTVAALNAVNGPMFVTASLSNDPATMAAWQALKAASEANVNGATGTAKALQDIADDRCKLAQGLIQRSHVEIKDLPGGAFVGIDYCFSRGHSES